MNFVLSTLASLQGRFADAFGTLYLGYACLWYYEQNRKVEGIDAVFELAMETLLEQNQNALFGVANNFPLPVIGPVMKVVSSVAIWLIVNNY